MFNCSTPSALGQKEKELIVRNVFAFRVREKSIYRSRASCLGSRPIQKGLEMSKYLQIKDLPLEITACFAISWQQTSASLRLPLIPPKAKTKESGLLSQTKALATLFEKEQTLWTILTPFDLGIKDPRLKTNLLGTKQ